MTSKEFFKLAQTKVAEYNNYNPLLPAVSWKNVFIVWYAKNYKGHKALLEIPNEDDVRYFEASYDEDEGYLCLEVYGIRVKLRHKISEG